MSPHRIVYRHVLSQGGIYAEYFVVGNLKRLCNRPIQFEDGSYKDIKAEQISELNKSHQGFGVSHELDPLELPVEVQFAGQELSNHRGIKAVMAAEDRIALIIGFGYFWKEDGVHDAIIDTLSRFLSLDNPRVLSMPEWEQENGFEVSSNPNSGLNDAGTMSVITQITSGI